MERRKHLRDTLGDILVNLGVVTADQVEEAEAKALAGQTDLLTALAEKGFAKEEHLLKAVSVSKKIPLFTSFDGILDLEVGRMIPEKMARRHLVIPLQITKKGLLLGVVNAVDVVAMDAVAYHTGLR